MTEHNFSLNALTREKGKLIAGAAGQLQKIRFWKQFRDQVMT